MIQHGLLRVERLANDIVLVSSPLKPLTDTNKEVHSGKQFFMWLEEKFAVAVIRGEMEPEKSMGGASQSPFLRVYRGHAKTVQIVSNRPLTLLFCGWRATCCRAAIGLYQDELATFLINLAYELQYAVILCHYHSFEAFCFGKRALHGVWETILNQSCFLSLSETVCVALGSLENLSTFFHLVGIPCLIIDFLST